MNVTTKNEHTITIETDGGKTFEIEVGKDLLIISTTDPQRLISRRRGDNYVVIRVEEQSK